MTASNRIYYLAKPGATQQEGPYSEQELYALYASRQLPVGSRLWTRGWSDWKPFERVFNWSSPQSIAPTAPPPLPSSSQPSFQTQPSMAPTPPPYPTQPGGSYSGYGQPNLVHSFVQCMKKYAVFSGRSTRQEYWSMSLAAFILFFVCGIGVGIVETDGNALGALLLLISVPGTLALIIPYWAVVVRRLHDIGWSGFVAIGLFLLGCIEGLNVIAFILFIIIGCIDSQRGTNQYGPSEKYPS